jgi:O-antigen ligase
MYYNPNWLAQLYGIACVGAVAAAARPGTRRLFVVLLLLSAAALLLCVGLTQTRGVLIGVLAGFAIIIVLLPGQTPLRIAIQLAVVAGVIVACMPLIEVLIARDEPYRMAFWKAYVPLVEAHPWAGSGLSTPIVVKAPDGVETTHPHNIIYHALLRGGVFAALTLVVFFAVTCLQSLRAWRIDADRTVHWRQCAAAHAEG